MRFFTFSVILMSFAALSACESKPKGPQPDRTPGRPSVPAKPKVTKPAPPEKLAELDVKQAMDTWLDAQNQGDFEAYSALYSTKFQGVKRVGEQTYKYGQKDWLIDRKRMFKAPMTVAYKNIELRAVANAAVVSFEQHWKSKAYADVGPKVIVWSSENGVLRIVREELLSSNVIGVSTTRDVLRFTPVIASRYVVLSENVDESWARDTPRLAEGVLAERSVEYRKVPAEYRRWKDLTVRVFRPGGQSCDARVEGLRIIARATPHFSTEAQWNGEMGGKPVDDRTRAKQGYELAGEVGRTLVAKLETPCVGGLYAQATNTNKEPAFATIEVATPTAELLEAYRSIEGWQNLQKEFEAMGNQGFWDERDSWKPQVQNFDFGDGTQFVVVSSRSGDGCGGFYGEFWAIYHYEDSTLIHVSPAENPGRFFVPTMAVKTSASERQGVVFLAPDLVVEEVDGVWSITVDLTPPNFDCPC